MYFPYLFARQGELKAVEDVAGRLGAPQKTFPILEPVTSNPRSLRSALDALAVAQASAYVIVNPSRHDLESAAAASDWEIEMASDLAAPFVRPVFEVRAGTSLSNVRAFLTTYSSRPVGISIRAAHLPARDIAAETAGKDVLHLLHSSADPIGYSTTIGAARSIEIRDSFRTEVRNADYSGEELFTTAHQHFFTEGRPGFSDYTLLPGRFNATGGPLGAAVIHMSFTDGHGALRVEHFVSDETRQYQSTQPAKLLEAMTKLSASVAARPGRFHATPGLTTYQAQFIARTPTNPTYNKRQQISHHIATVARLV